MKPNRPISLAGVILLLACESAEPGPIRTRVSPHTVPVLAGSPAMPGPEIPNADPLRLLPAMANFPSDEAHLPGHAAPETMVARALESPAAAPLLPGGLALPALPRATFGDKFTERLAPEIPEETVIVAAPPTRRNVRIPEPASLTLIAAGLIGLTARNRLRRSLTKSDSDLARGD